ncbi:GEVED domain-containing protein [Gillisia sp. Q332]|uniref:GEVED domain-containing protein n=1 Tax=Gillisia xinjiangensis TaxID=3384765 RepID=UPI003919EF14
MIRFYSLFTILLFLFSLQITAQKREISGPVYIDSAQAIPVSAISKRQLIAPSTEFKVVNPRNRGINKVVPGKGLPKTRDAALQEKMGEVPGKAPIFSFDAVTSRSTPTDPTGAAGPNHYVNGWNSAFSIFDKSGNRIVPPASLSSIGGEFTNENLGDPIVLYDEFADRFLIMQFSDTPSERGFLVAVSQGPDPVNDGWYTYRFLTNNVLPDYPKISVWSDGYYVTTNKNSNSASTSQVVYVLERDRMLIGETAGLLAFPLPGINTNGFYSPAGFHAMGGEMPPLGNSPIIYLQDDAWAGVSEDHLKIWNINVNWNSLANSTIQESQELGAASGVSPFIATFDGGAFSNLAQPNQAPDIDVLQATMMYMTQYRRFSNHNSVVMNFVVDVNPTAAEHAGIRWYELRQDRNGGTWSVFQEGTYAPDKSDRFSGSIGMDREGNIGLGYTVLDDSPVKPVFPSIRFTGRYANDPLGEMTLVEASIVEGLSPNPNTRYGDYAHLTLDPADGITFWHNGEYFDGLDRKNRVGVFQLAPDFNNDVGIIAIPSPKDATLSNSEAITVTIRNFGRNTQFNIPVSYIINGGQAVNEVFEGSLPGTSSVDYTFSTTANLGTVGQTYEVTASTNLAGDEREDNDEFSGTIRNLFPNDVGVTSIDAPSTGLELTSSEEITVTIENFGGEAQTNIPVSYRIENNRSVNETFSGTLPVGENVTYTFSQTANLSAFGRYNIAAETNLNGDSQPLNDGVKKSVANLNCIPEGSDCTSFGDGIFSFELEGILNERIACTSGYGDFIGSSTDLDRSNRTFTVRVKTLFDSPEGNEQFSMWIDLNDNGVFDDEERFISSQVIPSANTWHEYEFTLPADAALGLHLLRIRAGDVSFDGDLNNPCSVMDYGTTHDYSVRVTDSSISLDDFLLNEANLVISDQGNGIFRVFLETEFDETLRVTIHNLLGQKLLENKVESNGQGYLYEFDMSYAATGVYLLRIGTREVGIVKRFIVK